MKNTQLKSLTLALGCAIASPYVHAISVPLTSAAYCSPYEVTCKDDARIFGRCEPRYVRGKKDICYFTPPVGFAESMSRTEWAKQVCKTRGGVEKVKNPKIHLKIDEILNDAIGFTKDTTDADLLAVLERIQKTNWNKQKKYDAYIEATFGGYGTPVGSSKKEASPEISTPSLEVEAVEETVAATPPPVPAREEATSPYVTLPPVPAREEATSPSVTLPPVPAREEASSPYVTLPPVPAREASITTSSSRGSLMEQIRERKNLKHVDTTPDNKIDLKDPQAVLFETAILKRRASLEGRSGEDVEIRDASEWELN